MTEDQFIQLLQGFQKRQLSEAELHAFLNAVEDPQFESLLGDKLYAELVQIKAMELTQDPRADKIWETISAGINSPETVTVDERSIPTPARVHLLGRPWMKYAAAIVLVIGLGTFGWLYQQRTSGKQSAIADVAPGRDGAILTLEDGTRLVLDSLGNGVLADQKGAEVLLNDGSLLYNSTHASAVSFNTMSTPKGRQFKIQLPDGSKAWLNAASSITYPTAFIGDDRTVSITGEVYFEVTKDKNHPFKVKASDDVTVQVLGTSFDVKAYAGDASINTILLEGSVRLITLQKTQMLSPGQQTVVQENGNIELIKNADISKIMAWKNGLFNFQDESFEEVMKQLERWYDIEVKYVGDPPRKKFFGELGRDLTLSQVMDALQEIGIKFHIEGRTLVITQ